MKNHLISLTALPILLTMACGEVKTSEQQTEKMVPISPKTFGNVFEIDFKKASAKSLPKTHFTIEYPDSIEVSQNSQSEYVCFIDRDKKNIIENEFRIGYTTLTSVDTIDAYNLIANISSQLQISLKNNYISNAIDSINICGKRIPCVLAKVNYQDYAKNGYGDFYDYAVFVMFPTIEKKNSKAVMVAMSFLTRGESDFNKEAIAIKINNSLIGQMSCTLAFVE